MDMLNKIKIEEKDIRQKFKRFYKKIENKYSDLLKKDDYFISDQTSVWKKYDKERIYFAVSIVRHHKHKCPEYKTYKNYKCGYYDILENVYVVDEDREVDLSTIKIDNE